MAVAACSPRSQESARSEAVLEIPLRNGADSVELVSMLRRYAASEGGMHVDDVSEQWREFDRQSNMMAPRDRLTINVGVWRGENDDEPTILVDDRYHPGRAWVTFLRGTQPERNATLRNALISEMRRRWPDSQPIPILPSGGVPLASDLVETPDGYRITHSAATRYELPPDSLLVAR